MEKTLQFTPSRLQAQVVRTRNILGPVRPSGQPGTDVPDALLRLLQQAMNKPSLIQRAMAYLIPTSQLADLIPLIALDQDPGLQQTARQLLTFRLRPRLADPIWQHLQKEPQRLVYSDLLLTLAKVALSAHHGLTTTELDPSVYLATRTLAEQNGTPMSVAEFAGAIRQYLVRHECARRPVKDVMWRFHLDLASDWIHQLMIETFIQANETSLLLNAAILAEWLALPRPMPWPVINHYGEILQPEQWDDLIGQLVEKALADADSQRDDVLNSLAARHFHSWQKLFSLRRLLNDPRQVELLSRFYYLFAEPARQLPDQTVTIHLPRLVLVLRSGDASFYLYPAKLFEETKTRWLEQGAQANVDNDTRCWPVDQNLVLPVRQALLNEQDKRLDERSLVDELINNSKVSIIELKLDDAHYLFSRKILEEISFFEGLQAT